MESWGFELVADHFRFPRLLLKVPCDKVGEETLNFDRTLALSKLAQGINYQDLIQKILFLRFQLLHHVLVIWILETI